MSIMRDHYEGSEFDLTKGLAAGPYGDPNRWDWTPTGNMTLFNASKGSFERAISLFRTSYSIVAQARPHLPNEVGALVWYTQYAPSVSAYTPLYVASENAPVEYTRGSLFKYESNVAFWNFAAVGNWAARFYSYAMQDVQEVQRNLESEHMRAVNAIDATATKLLERSSNGKEASKAVSALLTEFTQKSGTETVHAYSTLWPKLISKYHDGYIALDADSSQINMFSMFYPKWWLEAVGFFNGPIVFKPLEPLEPVGEATGGSSSDSSNDSSDQNAPSANVTVTSSQGTSSLMLMIIMGGCVGVIAGYLWTKDSHNVPSAGYSAVRSL